MLLMIVAALTPVAGQRKHECDVPCAYTEALLLFAPHAAAAAAGFRLLLVFLLFSLGKSGYCRFEGCTSTAECPGGLCVFQSCHEPSCRGACKSTSSNQRRRPWECLP